MTALRPGSDAAAVPAWHHVRAVLVLPLVNTVLIPALIVLPTRDYRWPVDTASLAAAACGLLLFTAGLSLVVSAISLFVRIGQGTLAPWDPTRVLITSGVYRLSRNPMKSGLFLMLLGECLLVGSGWLALWTAAFIAANVVYIRCFEERGLERRFGSGYAGYCRRVPRWFGLRGLRDAVTAEGSAT